MTGEEVAAQLRISRQAVSQALKRATKKIFIEARKEKPDLDYFQLLGFVIDTLRIQDYDYEAFYKKIPSNVKTLIIRDGKKYRRIIK